MNPPPDRGAALESLLGVLRAFLASRIRAHLDAPGRTASPDLSVFGPHPLFANLPQLAQPEERLLLLLALVPHLRPNFFESLVSDLLPGGGDFPEIGGTKGVNHRGMLPTGETALFAIAGTDLTRRLEAQRFFAEDHAFARGGVLWLESVREGEPRLSGRLVLSQEWVDLLLHERHGIPRFGLDFPARRLATEMVWDDIVLHAHTRRQVEDIATWLSHHRRFEADENLRRKVKPGYRVLFHGPSGTGKTLAAALLGKQFDKDVYRIDLSQVVSKYIGETEKNLENVFRRAESKDWILFFDEADSLFGKRTNVQSAHDKYANQEVSYLLQRVEDYPGLMILASNFRNNLDDAFLRRFHSLVHFPMPGPSERVVLWKKSMPASLPLDPSVQLGELARLYEMSGASILNAVQFAVLQVFARQGESLTHEDLVSGVRKEYLKEEKSI
jgi:AAA+ superfamily predicted ATPase